MYGVYWWALKDVLRRQGYDVGDVTDVDMAGKYKGANDDETIVAADEWARTRAIMKTETAASAA